MPEPGSGRVLTCWDDPFRHWIRQATPADCAALTDLERRAFIGLGTAFYPLEDIECALDHFDGLSSRLIEEGHYFVVTDARENILAGGGWSKSELEYMPAKDGGDEARVGVVRCVYVAPQYARRGLARKVLHCIETNARSAGLRALTLTASKTAEALYLRAGYAPGPYHDVRLPNGHDLPLRPMKRILVPDSA